MELTAGRFVAVEHLGPEERSRYLGMRSAVPSSRGAYGRVASTCGEQVQ